jgi:DNA modification methylase
MVGGGTTLIECNLTGRKGIGIDINPEAIKITKERLNFDYLYSQPRNLLSEMQENLKSFQIIQ